MWIARDTCVFSTPIAPSWHSLNDLSDPTPARSNRQLPTPDDRGDQIQSWEKYMVLRSYLVADLSQTLEDVRDG